MTTAQDLADQVSGSLSTASGLADDLGRWLAIAALVAAFAVALGLAGARLITTLSPDLQATMGSSMQLPPGAPPEAGGMMGALGGAAQTVSVQLAAPISLDLVLLAGALGGWRASRLRPADALRRLD